MLVFTSASELCAALPSSNNNTIGLVPTMGALHQGHLTLIDKARFENANVVVSIFVNPTQFNRPEDLEKYPKNLTQDLQTLAPYTKNLFVFAPTVEEIYPHGLITNAYEFGSLTQFMEGRYREGHFNGVATVVESLFRKIRPYRAYFGEKDFQQLQIIKTLAKQIDFKVEIVSCPIIRDNDGLAMSSRNSLLSPIERKAAAKIYKALNTVATILNTDDVEEMERYFYTIIKVQPELEIEYFCIAEPENLIPVRTLIKEKKYRLFTAVYAGKTRLIDTLELHRK